MKRAWIALVILTALLLPVMPVMAATETVYEATVLPTNYQQVKGWGLTPAYISEAAIFRNKYEAQNVLYKELGTTIQRIELSFQCMDLDGNLVLEHLDRLAGNIRLGLDNGVEQYLLTLFSPPAVFKDNQSQLGRHPDGTVAKLPEENEQPYCDYVVDVLDYLVKEQHLPRPTALSVQNEPENAMDYQSLYLTGEQFIRLTKLMRKTMDEAGYQDVTLIGPEGGSYINTEMWLGENFSDLERDKDLQDALDAFASHSYMNKRDSQDDGPRRVAALYDKFPEKDRWQTEVCNATIEEPLEIDRVIDIQRIMNADMGFTGINYWFWWIGWSPRCNISDVGQQCLIDGEGVSIVNKGLQYYALETIYNNAPVGSYIRRMETDDPGVKNDGGLMTDMVAYEHANGTLAVLVNTSKDDKVYNFNGMKGSSATVYTIQASGFGETARQNIAGGTVKNIAVPARSIVMVSSSQTDVSYPDVQFVPERQLSQKGDVYVSRSREITFTVTSDEPATIVINGQSYTTDTDLSVSVPLTLSSATTRVQVQATDENKNSAPAATYSFTYDPDYVGIDLEDPQTVVSSAAYPLTGKLNTAGTLTVNGEQVAVSEDLSFETTVALEQGDNTITLSAEDTEGNKSDPMTLQVFCDSLAPEVTFTDPNTTEDAEFVLHGQVNEDVKYVMVNGQEAVMREGNTFVEKVVLQEGENNVVVTATDLYDNVGQTPFVVTYTKTDQSPHFTDGVSYTRFTGNPVSIDGRLSEADWRMDNKASLLISGSGANNIVNFGTLWDNENLYIGAKVVDHILAFTHSQPYNNDCVEVFLNPSNQKRGTYQEGDRQLFVGYPMGRTGLHDNNVSGVKTGWQDVEDGYTVEMAIPWNVIGVQPGDGVEIGFDLTCDDNEGGITRETVLAWNGTSNNWQDTSGFGTLILSTEPDVPYVDREIVFTPGGNVEDPDEPTEPEQEIKVYVGGVPVTYDVAPVMVNERVMVPIRATAEALDLEVRWDEASGRATLLDKYTSIVLSAGDSTAYVNTQSVQLDAAPILTDGRILVPLRFISEAMQHPVEWDPESNSVKIQ